MKAWLALGREGEGEVCWEKVIVSRTRELCEGRLMKVKDRVFICLLRRYISNAQHLGINPIPAKLASLNKKSLEDMPFLKIADC